MPKVAVVLCGCGRADGSEIHESVSCLVHLSRLGAQYHCFAPDQPQTDVINHLTGKPEPGQSRNMLVEAARIARGAVSPLSMFRAAQFDAVVFPGGFGVAKNLCSFAREGDKCSVIPDVERVLNEFHAAGKPIGLCCIAPVLAGRVFGTARGGNGCKVTLGEESDAAAALARMGATHVAKRVEEACVDDANRLATSPAYMDDHATPYQVFVGIGHMIESVVAMAATRHA
ncbi:MAG: isoprenoid biosynthesis glyoxalase ElbB [Phycisphaerae bacterium]|nr:isoprenoid biosynthesis glyoxalase ElbB [Phycisphaerae bacterium]